MPYQGDLTNVVTDVYREWQGDFRSQIDTAASTADDALALAGDPTLGLTVIDGDLVLTSGYDLVVAGGDLEVTGNAIISGAITSGLVNGQTISAAASFTGSLAVAGSAALSGGTQIGASGTPLTQVKIYTPSLTPASVLASISAEQTFNVPGLTTADSISVSGPAPAMGSGLVNARVSGADTLALTFVNDTLAAVTPTAGVYRIVAVRS
jgi:hypothetical protein